MYRGVEVGLHRLDLLVNDTIVVELKAAREIVDAHFAIVRRTYARALRARPHPQLLQADAGSDARRGRSRSVPAFLPS